jgi:hypothetical protein
MNVITIVYGGVEWRMDVKKEREEGMDERMEERKVDGV